MAREKGKSGSTKPLSDKPPSWITHSAKETKILVKKLAKKGYPPSKIGIILRDSYGIPDVKSITGKKISEIAEDHLEQDLPEELASIIKKIINLRKHLEKNKKDKKARQALEIANSRIRKKIKYYKKKGKLPQDWKFKIDEAEKLV